jgi:hypothetical protein
VNDTEKKIISQMLDELILQAAPKSKTVPKYGGVLYTVKPDEKEGQFCGIFVYKNHVNLSFANGTSLKDPAGVLLGTGESRRHINFKSADEVDSKILLALLKQSAKL